MAVKLNFAQIGFTEGLLKFLRNPIFPDLSTSGDLEVDGTAAVTGLVALAGPIVANGLQTIAAGGTTTAVDLTKSIIEVGADAGGDIVTIAAGTLGQEITLVCVDATGVTTITPATFNGGTSVTFDAVGESIVVKFGSLGWTVIGGNDYTVI